MTADRVHNFGAGPAALPLEVLEQMQSELLDYRGTGLSILESSHRGPAYARVHDEAIECLRRLLGITDDHVVLFMGGGARTQFSAVPMNLLQPGERAAYLTTGRWGEMALAAAQAAERAGSAGKADEIWTGADRGHNRVPDATDYGGALASSKYLYLHYTSNNTIYGTQYPSEPESGSVPLVADMSSDILSRPLDLSRFAVIYAGAQKNLGPAGVTVVVVRRDWLSRPAADLPATLSYVQMAAKNSLLNTPPVFAIYAVGLVLAWLEKRGGLAAVAGENDAKAALLYDAIDRSGGFYRGHAIVDSRSKMNVTFNLASPELEGRFLATAAENGLVGLKGHRSVGGVRASLYNAVQRESVEVLVDFMADFAKRSG